MLFGECVEKEIELINKISPYSYRIINLLLMLNHTTHLYTIKIFLNCSERRGKLTNNKKDKNNTRNMSNIAFIHFSVLSFV